MILNSYTRRDSPFVHVQYSGLDGRRVCQKTRIRKDDPDRERKVQLELNRLQRKMLVAPVPDDGQYRESWGWVIPWLKGKHAARKHGQTLRIYLTYWHWLSQFLAEQDIGSPGFLEREDVFSYIEWRRGQVKEKSGRSPGLNTALNEVKILGMIMKEAILRGYAVENPAIKLGIEREESAETPAMEDAEIAQVFRELQTRPLWMRRSFEVAYHTALRFATTQLHRSQVRWERREIGIPNPKGGRKREFAIPLPAALEPMLREWWETGEPRLWEVPEKERTLCGLRWTQFFREIGLPHLKFHSTRTTFITRGALGDPARGVPPIPEAVMMKLVNHGAKEVHRLYQRFSSHDLAASRDRLALPPLGEVHCDDGATVESPHQRASHPSRAIPPPASVARSNKGSRSIRLPPPK